MQSGLVDYAYQVGTTEDAGVVPSLILISYSKNIFCLPQLESVWRTRGSKARTATGAA
jgi:hypothetical protein